MKRLISFGSIEQYRNLVKKVTEMTRFAGLDEEGKAIFNNDPLPTLTFTATEKVHGTQGAICYSKPDGFWVQSRKNIITPEKDNAGCAAWCYEREAQWMVLVEQLSEFHNIDLNKNIITIYFEFAGENIQKILA